MHIVLIGCSKKKKDGQHPARELYSSPLFRKSLAYAEAIGDEVFIVSSYWELVPLDKVIQSYEESLYDKPRDVRAAWGDRIVGELLLVNPAAGIAGDIQLTILAGDMYIKPILKGVRSLGIDWQINDPLKGLSVGERLRWLNEQLDRVKA